jgi:glycosyltransferase involved in cell wall biosynthesis
MSKILLISWTVPPETTGSAVIVGNLAKQFTADEMIVAGEQPTGKPRLTWESGWPRIVYISKGWPLMKRGGRWWRRLQLPIMFIRSLRLALKHHCSAIVAVFPNAEFLLTGYLTAKCTGASFFPYFHNTWVENREGLVKRYARWLQSLVFAEAEHVFLMSEGMVELFRERYKGLKCSALLHSFNERLSGVAAPPNSGSPYRFTISGTISESCRDATVRVCEAIHSAQGTELVFLTGTARSYLEELGLLKNGTRYDTVSRDELVDRLRESDIVVLPHGFTGEYSPEEYRTIFPTRTIEYLICGRPILAHTPPDAYLTRFLRAHDCALIVDQPSVPELIKAIERLRSDEALRSRLVPNALKAAEQFEAARISEVFRARVNGSVS